MFDRHLHCPTPTTFSLPFQFGGVFSSLGVLLLPWPVKRRMYVLVRVPPAGILLFHLLTWTNLHWWTSMCYITWNEGPEYPSAAMIIKTLKNHATDCRDFLFLSCCLSTRLEQLVLLYLFDLSWSRQKSVIFWSVSLPLRNFILAPFTKSLVMWMLGFMYK